MKKFFVIAVVMLGCQTRPMSGPNLLSGEFSSYQLPTQKPDLVPEMVEQIRQGLVLTMIENISLIWSNYSWDGLQVLFVYPSQEHSYLWSVDNDTVLALASADLPSEAQGLFAPMNINGRLTLTLNLEHFSDSLSEDIPPEAVIDASHFHADFWAKLAAHEFFHFAGQRDWSLSYPSRRTNYPRRFEPRLYRHMIFQNLAGYWRGSTRQGLNHARYWYERWQQEFPAEQIHTTDVTEGSAYYVDVMTGAMMALQAEGKELSAANLHNFLLNNGQNLFATHLGSSLDVEGYGLGGLAVTMLRFDAAGLGLGLEQWNRLVAANRNPLDILLQKSQALEQPHDAALLEKLKKLTEDANSSVAPAYDLLISQWQDPSGYVRVRLPLEFLYSQGNLMPSDFGYLQAIDQEAVHLAQPHNLVGKTQLKIEGAYISDSDKIVIMLPRSLFRQTEEKQEINIPDGPIRGKLQGRLVAGEGPVSYFIAE